MSVTHRRLLLALLITSGILNYADRQIIAVLKPLLQEQLHWSDGDYGHLTALFQFAAAFAYLGAGWVVDRVGWRAANPLAVATWSLAAMAHGLVHTLGQFSLVRVALGATESLGTPTAIKTIAALFTAKERSVALGAMNAAGNVGAIVTPLFVPVLALTWGWKSAFLVTGGVGLVWVAVWQWAARSAGPAGPGGGRLPVEVRAGAGAAGLGGSGGGAGAEVRAGVGSAGPGAPVQWGTVLSDRRTWAIAGGKVLSDQVWWFLLFWMPDFFHRVFNLNMKSFAVPLAVVYATAALGSLLGGFVSGRLISHGAPPISARFRTMLICALLVTPVPIALFVANYWVAVALLSLALAAHQGFSVNLFALTTDVTPESRVGTVISVAALFGNLSGMAILQTAGWLLGSGYGFGPLFGLAAVAYLLALAWIRMLLPKNAVAIN
jgi:ACS family hexuronate transporter-like MFS transporter